FRHIDENAMAEAPAVERLLVPAHRLFVMRRAVDIVEEEARQPPPRGAPQIVDVDDHPGARAAPASERLFYDPRDLADDAAAERQHADHEDAALDDADPGARALGKEFLDRDEHDGARDRPEYRAHATQERHQHDLARHRPIDVAERGAAGDEDLRAAGE